MTRPSPSQRQWNNEPPPHLVCPPGTYLTFDGKCYTCQPLTDKKPRSLSTQGSMVVGIVLILFSLGILFYLMFVLPHP